MSPPVIDRPVAPAADSPVDESVLCARAYLSRVAEPASVPVWQLVQRLGPVDAARAIRRGTVPDAVAAATAARRDSADPIADLEAAGRHRARLVTPEHADWPHLAVGALQRALARRLAAGSRDDTVAPVPPIALWVTGAGDLASLGSRAVAVVGARAATAYGEHVGGDLGYGLARREVVVVSGGAFGIDAVAHRGALAAEGVTVLVTAAGIDRPYPSGHAALFAAAAERGLVISESPPGSAPHRHRFLTRNRLIAAFATGTVVVEAARRSGAASTAAHCVSLGRPLMAVPGPVTSAMSVGCHEMLRRHLDPALLVTNVDDVLEIVGGIGERSGSRTPGSETDLRARLDGLDLTARRVFDGLTRHRFTSAESIARRCGVPVMAVVRALPDLSAAGLMEESDGGYRTAPASATEVRKRGGLTEAAP
jgi:DNA processing protein